MYWMLFCEQKVENSAKANVLSLFETKYLLDRIYLKFLVLLL